MTQHNYLTQMANAIIYEDTEKEFNYSQLSNHPKHKEIWKQSFSNELGRLAQGSQGQLKGTNTMFFISHDHVPSN